MFTFLNKEKAKAIKKVRAAFASAPVLRSKKGQAAAVLLSIAAVGLILYAVSLNFGRISQQKTLTIRAANASAAMMASMMASYGESVFRTQLGGREKYCDSTSILGAILGVIIAIIGVVLAAYTSGGSFSMTNAGVALAMAALVLSVVNLVLQVTVVQPGITAMWNEMISEAMTIEGQTIERGIQTALQNVVTDQVQIPDEYDQDGDGIFGPLSDVWDPNSTPDKVSRFAHYYTRRLQGVEVPGGIDLTEIENFQTALRDFLYAHWAGSPLAYSPGLYDPVDSCDCETGDPCLQHPCCGCARDCTAGAPGVPVPIPAFCDPCCVDQFKTDDQGNTVTYCSEYDPNEDPSCWDALPNPTCTCLTWEPVRLRPQCCDEVDPETLTTTCLFATDGPGTCASRSPYAASVGVENYPYLYNYFYEDATNNHDPTYPVVSYLESIGRDDEHRYYSVNPLRPQWHTNPAADSQTLMSPLPATLLYRFRGVDTTGFYPPASPPPAQYDGEDQVGGVFSHFYALADLGTDLSALTYMGDQRHWCDPRNVGAADPFTNPNTGETQLALPVDFDGTGVPYTQTSWCVDQGNMLWPSGSTAITLADHVPLPGYILTDFNVCAIPNAPGTWKRGADYFCSQRFPYTAYCPDRGWDPVAGTSLCTFDVSGTTFPADCLCTEAAGVGLSPALYSEDYLDKFLFEMKDFLVWAEDVLMTPAISIRTNFANWYNSADSDNDFSDWFGAGGRFQTYIADLDAYISNITSWLGDDPATPDDYIVGTTYGGSDDAWCIPDSATPCVNDGEYLDAGGLQVFGIDGVVHCLDFNVNDTVTYPISGATVTGNAEKFDRCAIDCSLEHCEDLPRSVDPDYCANWDFYSPTPDYTELQLCLASRPVPAPAMTGTVIVPPDGSSTSNAYVDCDVYCDIPSIQSGIITGNQDPPQTATIDPPFVAEDTTYTCTLENSCDPASAFMTAVNAAIALIDDGATGCTTFAGSDCAADRPAFAACQAAAGMCGAAYPAISGDISVYQLCSTACAGLPASWSHDGGPVAYGLPVFTGISVDYAVNVLNSCGQDGPGPDDDFFDDVANAVSVAGSSCDDPNYSAAVAASANEAKVQVAKFGKRLEFLRNRRDEAVAAQAALEAVRDAIQAFLDGPAQDMIDSSGALATAVDRGDTKSVVIYAWQDPKRDAPRLDNGSYQGYWHIVKVETRAPKRCLNYCGAGSGTDWATYYDPEFPWVRTWTKNWGTTRCYELMAREGRVKTRVIRYDEDAQRSKLSFPDGTPVWSFRFWHPATGAPSSPAALDAACDVYVDDLVAKYDTPTPRYFWNKAFMINDIPSTYADCIAKVDPPTNCTSQTNCWSMVHEFLKHGVSTVQCAQYEFNGMFSIRFVPCDEKFLEGELKVNDGFP